MMEDQRKVQVLTVIVLMGILVLAPLGFMANIEKVRFENAKETYAKALEQDYTAYLDGKEIDISKIGETNYVITVDTEDECLYLSKKGFWDWGQVIRVR